MSDGLRELLTDRLAEEDMAPEIPISVAELHRRLLPYALCRQRLGFASKAEYDIGFLRLLVDDESLHVPEVALLKAARDELESPEPGLALLQRFAASEVRLRARPSGSTRKSPETGPPIAELETGRSRGDHLPGLDDPLLVPQDESADALGRVATVETTASDAPVRKKESGSSAHCRSCDASLPNRSGLRFCPQCGADQEHWPCPACGEEVERGWSYCALCGKMLPT
jgi:predicted RNA-binding Zn-ribbon protein involved in translation (DUF1610 family)